MGKLERAIRSFLVSSDLSSSDSEDVQLLPGKPKGQRRIDHGEKKAAKKDNEKVLKPLPWPKAMQKPKVYNLPRRIRLLQSWKLSPVDIKFNFYNQQEPQQLPVQYKRRSIAVIYFVLEAISFILDLCGKNRWSFLLPAFLLSVFGFALTIYASTIKRNRTTGSIRLQAEKQLEVIEIAFSVVQLVVTFIHFILAVLGVKNSTYASAFPLVFATILVLFAFRKNREFIDFPDQGDNISSSREFSINMNNIPPSPNNSVPDLWTEAEANQVDPVFIDDHSVVSEEPAAVGRELSERAIRVSNDPQGMVLLKAINTPSTSEVAGAIESKTALVSRLSTGSSLPSHIELADRLQDFEDQIVACYETEAAREELSELHTKISNDDSEGVATECNNASIVVAGSGDCCVEDTN